MVTLQTACPSTAGFTASAIQARLREATSAYTYRQVGASVSCHPESVRRWLTTETRPPIWFIVALCEALHLNPHWALTGLGPMHRDPELPPPLSAAPPRLLLERLATMLDDWAERSAPVEVVPTRRRAGRERACRAVGSAT